MYYLFYLLSHYDYLTLILSLILQTLFLVPSITFFVVSGASPTTYFLNKVCLCLRVPGCCIYASCIWLLVLSCTADKSIYLFIWLSFQNITYYSIFLCLCSSKDSFHPVLCTTYFHFEICSITVPGLDYIQYKL